MVTTTGAADTASFNLSEAKRRGAFA